MATSPRSPHRRLQVRNDVVRKEKGQVSEKRRRDPSLPLGLLYRLLHRPFCLMSQTLKLSSVSSYSHLRPQEPCTWKPVGLKDDKTKAWLKKFAKGKHGNGPKYKAIAKGIDIRTAARCYRLARQKEYDKFDGCADEVFEEFIKTKCGSIEKTIEGFLTRIEDEVKCDDIQNFSKAGSSLAQRYASIMNEVMATASRELLGKSMAPLLSNSRIWSQLFAGDNEIRNLNDVDRRLANCLIAAQRNHPMGFALEAFMFPKDEHGVPTKQAKCKPLDSARRTTRRKVASNLAQDFFKKMP